MEMSGNRGTEAFPCYGLTRDSTNCSLVCACVCLCAMLMVVVDPEIECDVKFNRFRPLRYNKYPLTRKWSNVVMVLVTGGVNGNLQWKGGAIMTRKGGVAGLTRGC